MTGAIADILLGQHGGARRRYAGVALAVGALAALVPIGVRVAGVTGGMATYGLTLLLMLVAAILALTLPVAAGYRGAGLVVCLAIPTAVVLGLNVAYWVAIDTVRWTLWHWGGPPLGMLLGVPLGTAGYAVGTVLDSLL